MEELLGKYFAGEASQDEKERVVLWRSESEENSRIFFEYKTVWAATTKLEQGNSPVSSTHLQPAQMSSRPQKFNVIKIAAAIAVLLVATFTVILKWEDWTTYDTGLVQKEKLDDGTRVYMYKDATVEVLDFSDEERRVAATGRVFFDVRKNPDRPFIIETPQAIVQVLGTSFQLTTEKEYTTEVTVESGQVNFKPNPDADLAISTSILINKGEKGIITPNAKGIIKQNNRDKNYLAWQNLNLTVDQQNLSDFSSLMEEVYGYSLSFSNAQLGDCTLSAKYNNKSPEEIAELLATTFNVQYSVEGKKIVLTGDSCY
jgi:ferric-dicitrate binding protein FerR (iron transport regulator)